MCRRSRSSTCPPFEIRRKSRGNRAGPSRGRLAATRRRLDVSRGRLVVSRGLLAAVLLQTGGRTPVFMTLEDGSHFHATA